jgi:hypothetical protein
MSLTLARLCGEWQLVSKYYNAWSGKQIIQDMNNLRRMHNFQDSNNLRRTHNFQDSNNLRQNE